MKNATNALSLQGMRQFLSNGEISDRIAVYDVVDSTNIIARDLVASEVEKKDIVIIANGQTAGRGRYGRSFFSPPGHGLYMSFIIDTSLTSQESMEKWSETPALITAFSAVAVCQAVEETTEKAPQIKWINDIFYSGKKVCGISAEAVTDGASRKIKAVIVGIGVNFTTPDSGEYPSEIKNIAGSLYSASEKPPIRRNQLAAEIINRMTEIGNKTDINVILAEYRKRLFVLGKEVTVTAGHNEPFSATAIDIDEKGQLIIKTDESEIKTLSSAEISIKI